MAHIRVYGRFLVEYGRLAFKNRRWTDNTLFLQAAYQVFLRRAPDVDGCNYYLQELQYKRMKRKEVLRSLLQSIEFKQIYGFGIGTIEAAHQARKIVYRELIPSA